MRNGATKQWHFMSSVKSLGNANPVDVEKAEDHYHRALALADGLRLRPLVAHCHGGLGKLYQGSR